MVARAVGRRSSLKRAEASTVILAPSRAAGGPATGGRRDVTGSRAPGRTPSVVDRTGDGSTPWLAPRRSLRLGD
jgi:hypothetical protein